MLEQILEYERNAFLWLNDCHTPFGDLFMYLYSGKMVWMPFVLAFLCMLFYKKSWKEGLFFLVAIALTITLCDQFASGFCKPMFTRFRPTHHPAFMEQVHTAFGYRGGRYGFISSHACNAFGFVTFTALLFRHRGYTIAVALWALLTVYSRIYLGVHFISDIIPGILAGTLFGYLVYRLYIVSRPKIIPASERVGEYPTAQINLLLYVLLAIVVFLLVVSALYSMEFIPAIGVK